MYLALLPLSNAAVWWSWVGEWRKVMLESRLSRCKIDKLPEGETDTPFSLPTMAFPYPLLSSSPLVWLLCYPDLSLVPASTRRCPPGLIRPPLPEILLLLLRDCRPLGHAPLRLPSSQDFLECAFAAELQSHRSILALGLTGREFSFHHHFSVNIRLLVLFFFVRMCFILILQGKHTPFSSLLSFIIPSLTSTLLYLDRSSVRPQDLRVCLLWRGQSPWMLWRIFGAPWVSSDRLLSWGKGRFIWVLLVARSFFIAICIGPNTISQMEYLQLSFRDRSSSTGQNFLVSCTWFGLWGEFIFPSVPQLCPISCHSVTNSRFAADLIPDSDCSIVMPSLHLFAPRSIFAMHKYPVGENCQGSFHEMCHRFSLECPRSPLLHSVLGRTSRNYFALLLTKLIWKSRVRSPLFGAATSDRPQRLPGHFLSEDPRTNLDLRVAR